MVGFLFTSTSPTLYAPIVTTIFGILIAISFQWLYFNLDGRGIKVISGVVTVDTCHKAECPYWNRLESGSSPVARGTLPFW